MYTKSKNRYAKYIDIPVRYRIISVTQNGEYAYCICIVAGWPVCEFKVVPLYTKSKNRYAKYIDIQLKYGIK